MSTQRNHEGANVPRGPGPVYRPGRFALTPNRFSKVHSEVEGENHPRQDLAKLAAQRNGHAGRSPSGINSPYIVSTPRLSSDAVARDRGKPGGGPENAVEKRAAASGKANSVTRPGTTERQPENQVSARVSNQTSRLKPATSVRATTAATNSPTTQSKPTVGTSSKVSDSPDSQSCRSLGSLSVDDFMNLCALNSSRQIAAEYGVQVNTVHSLLSKTVRKKANQEGRTLENVKDELNVKRVASGVIPVNDGKYGVRTLPPRARHGGGQSEMARPAASRYEGVDSDAMEVDLEESAESAAPAGAEAEFDYHDVVGEGEVGDEDEVVVSQRVDIKQPAAETKLSVEHGAEGEGMKIVAEGSTGDHINDIGRPAGSAHASASNMVADPFEGVKMPDEVLHNPQALHLWALGYRAGAVKAAEETKQYLNDFVLRPEDFDRD